MILDATTKTLEFLLSGAVTTNQLPAVVSYVDVTTTTYSPGEADTISNGASVVTLLNAPAASTQRQVKEITIYNKDTVSAVVTVQLNNNTTVRILLKVTLAVGSTLVYTDVNDWYVLSAAGAIQQSSTSTLLDGLIHTDTLAGTVVRGDTIIGNSTPKWSRLAIGSANKLLRSDGADVSWGPVVEADLNLTDVTTANVTSTAHGFAPKSPADATKFLNGATTPAWAQVKDSDLVFTDITTNDVSTSKHGFAPKRDVHATIALTDGATPALDASLGNVYRLAAAGDRTIAVPSNAVAGQKIIIEHFASGGGRTLALNTGAGGFRFGTDITSLTLTASGKTDYIGCVYNDTDSKWDVVAVTKGF